jgi:hypothetical protein
MMHTIGVESSDFAAQWESDVPTIVVSAPTAFTVGDTIKMYETTWGVTTGRYTLAMVTGVVPLSNAFVTVYQTIFQRAVQ